VRASKPYQFHPEAWQEFEAADDWYAERSADASVGFLSAITDAFLGTQQKGAAGGCA